MKTKQIKKFYNKIYHNEVTNPVDIFMQNKRCKIIRKYLLRETGKILVVGCGSKGDMTVLPEGSEGFGVDISEEAINISEKKYPNYKFCVADASLLPFLNDSFDHVVCSEVIEHVYLRDKAFMEIKRVLKNGGTFIVTTPNWFSSWGLARKVAEKIMKKPVTASDQPIDNWSTLNKLGAELKKFGFEPCDRKGLWFYPPFGKGKFRVPYFLSFPIVFLFYPFELLFRFVLPWFGHIIIIKSTLKK